MAKQEWYVMVQMMREAAASDQENLTAHLYLGWGLTNLGLDHEAREVLRRIMTLEPRSPVELESKAWAAGVLGDKPTQELLFQKSARLDAGRPEPHRALASLYKRDGRIAEALHEFEAAFAMGGYQQPDEWREFCGLYQTVGDSTRAKACEQSALYRMRTRPVT
jgi:tetratricopeptide (TPR) repeat protein